MFHTQSILSQFGRTFDFHTNKRQIFVKIFFLQHQVYSSQPFRLPAPLPIVASKNETLPPSSLSLPDDDVLSKQNAGTDMENCHDAGDFE